MIYSFVIGCTLWVRCSWPLTTAYWDCQGLQLRSQSQHSLLQGMSLSQLSQNSLDEIAMNEQRFGSQERDNSLKRISSLPSISYPREESQMLVSRSSNNVTRRWNSSSGPDYRCQVSEELEHRIGLMETSLSRLGMVLDSVQSDVMLVNKSVKEDSMESLLHLLFSAKAPTQPRPQKEVKNTHLLQTGWKNGGSQFCILRKGMKGPRWC